MKQKIYSIIKEDGEKNKLNRWFNLLIISLIILSVLEIILESYPSLNIKYKNKFYLFESIAVSIFTIEYLLRVWTADLLYPQLNSFNARIKFIFSPLGIIDLLAIIPFFLPFIFKFDLRFIRILRITRLLMIFKLNRHTKVLHLLGSIFKEKWSELSITIFVTFILILISSTLMYYVEHDIQPDKFPNIISTCWWSIATLTTIGYGDVIPITGWGKLLSGIIALLGIGLVALPTGILSAAFIEKMEEEKERKKGKKHLHKNKKYTYCPHCGELLK